MVKLTSLALTLTACAGLAFTAACGDDNGNGNTGPTGNEVRVGLTLPDPAPGRPLAVLFDNDLNGDNGHVYAETDVCTATSDIVPLELVFIEGRVPAGSYYVYAVVGVVSDLSAGPQPGDYYGIYGGVATPQRFTVPATGVVSLDIDMGVFGG